METYNFAVDDQIYSAMSLEQLNFDCLKGKAGEIIIWAVKVDSLNSEPPFVTDPNDLVFIRGHMVSGDVNRWAWETFQRFGRM